MASTFHLDRSVSFIFRPKFSKHIWQNGKHYPINGRQGFLLTCLPSSLRSQMREKKIACVQSPWNEYCKRQHISSVFTRISIIFRQETILYVDKNKSSLKTRIWSCFAYYIVYLAVSPVKLQNAAFPVQARVEFKDRYQPFPSSSVII